MRRTAMLMCAIFLTATEFALLASAQPAAGAKELKFAGKMADGTQIEFVRSPEMKMTFSNGWTITKLLPGMDRAGRRFSGMGKAGDKNLVVTGNAGRDEVQLTVTVGIGKGATSESVKLEKAK